MAGEGEEFVVHPKTYIVIDIGGGTVDIASHSIAEGHIAEIAIPAGNFWGGTTVNIEFSKFLQEFVNDRNFSRYVQSGTVEEQTRHKADLNRLLYGNTGFESEKMRFGSGDGESQNSYYFEFPYSFWKLYKDSILKRRQQLPKGVQVDNEGAAMRICNSKMAEFFQPAIHEITNLIASHLRENNLARTIDTIYWVGGFGGCKYLRKQLETFFENTKYNFPVPPEPNLAVILGATAFRCDPSIVRKRKADATYGTVNFEAKGSKDEIFHVLVQKGEDIGTDKVLVMNFPACEKNRTSATFPLYSTLETNVKYTTDKGVQKLGEVTIDLEENGSDREIELVCDMTHTEIHIRAREKRSGKERKVVVDFLSSHN